MTKVQFLKSSLRLVSFISALACRTAKKKSPERIAQLEELKREHANPEVSPVHVPVSLMVPGTGLPKFFGS